MPSIFIILIIVVLIMLGAFFAVMVRIGAAGVNPSKLMSDIFEKKTDDNDNDIELKNKLRANVTIQRWRLLRVYFLVSTFFSLVFLVQRY